jgi:membrane protein
MKPSLSPTYLKALFLETVWNSSKTELSGWQAGVITSLRITHLIIRDIMEGMITLRAMGLVYTTILALVPLLAVSFSVLKGFGVHNQIEPFLLNLLLPLGDKGAEVTAKIIEFVDNTKAGVLGSLGLALLLFTVISLLQKIEQSFNYTWHVLQLRSMGKRFSDYLTVVMIGPVLLFSALGITASIANVSVIQNVMQIESIGFLTQLVGRLLPYLLIISAFTFVYMFVPNTKVKFKSALIGAIVSGVLWETSSWVFASFVVGSSKYTAIYSAFASMIIFFIWLYVTWVILLIGCSISYYHQNPSQQNLDARKINLSNREKETIALNIMVLIGKHYHAHKAAWTIESLALHMNISSEACIKIIKQLLNKNLLNETADTPTTYIPAYDLETIPVYDIISAIRCSGETKSHALNLIETEDDVKQLQKEIDESIERSLKQKSLKDLSI